MIDNSNGNVVSVLKQLSSHDWAQFGVNNIAYLKRVKTGAEEQFAIHAADGTPLAVVNDRATAFATLMQNDLEPVTVH